MKYQVSKNHKNNDQTWAIRPLAGPLIDKVVAVAEGVGMERVVFEGKTIIGEIRAVWGVTIADEQVYSEPRTLRGLGIGGRFGQTLPERLELDYDGFVNRSNRARKSARRLCVMGEEIYGGGTV